MPAHDAAVRVVHSSLAAQKRHHPEADHSELRRDLRAAQLEAHVREVVDSFPTLTREQRHRLRLLLQGGDGP